MSTYIERLIQDMTKMDHIEHITLIAPHRVLKASMDRDGKLVIMDKSSKGTTFKIIPLTYLKKSEINFELIGDKMEEFNREITRVICMRYKDAGSVMIPDWQTFVQTKSYRSLKALIRNYE